MNITLELNKEEIKSLFSIKNKFTLQPMSKKHLNIIGSKFNYNTVLLDAYEVKRDYIGSFSIYSMETTYKLTFKMYNITPKKK